MTTKKKKKSAFWAVFISIMVVGLLVAGGFYYVISINKNSNPHNAETIGEVPLPLGYTRVEAAEGSFAAWLRELPLRPKGTKVYLYNSSVEANYQWLSAAVLDWNLLSDDEQCADVCMRMRAEYLFSTKQYDKIRFVALNGDKMNYTGGGNRKAFESFMRQVFASCNTTSLCKSMETRELEDLQIGDVFIYPHRKVDGKTRYGHAVLVADMAVNARTGKKMILCVEGNTPARDVHILRNLNPLHNAWFALEGDEDHLRLNMFHFKDTDLRHF